jgi:hypothetical protein
LPNHLHALARDAPTTGGRLLFFASFALLALACGRLKSGEVGGAAGTTGAAADGGPDASTGDAGGCLLGASSIITSVTCARNPELCGVACGAACVDLARDAENCGGCGVTCKTLAACNDGVCGAEPGQLVPPAPGCRSIRLVLDDGAITWADMGHGTINRISTTGGAVTTLATGVLPAAIYTAGNQPLFVNSEPVGAGIVVHAGTVYWIGSADSVSLDGSDIARGGAGTSILSVGAGGAMTTLLPAALAPGPSPVSATADGGVPVETPGDKPPISAIALSPDARTLYFGAGTRLYKIPSTGAVTAADVELVGFTSGPERGFATALAADDRRLYFPSTGDTWVEIFDLTKTCDAAMAAGYACPGLVFGSHPLPLLDTVTVKDNFLTWAKEGNVWRADLTAADPVVDGHVIFSDTVAGFAVTGFAVGPKYAYFGESVYVEKGGFTPVEGTGPPRARILAKGQTWPSSLAIDGVNVYWTTTACDIAFIGDSPQ